MNAIFAAALLACLQGEARCVIHDDGPVNRVYVCGLGGTGNSATFAFRGFDGDYVVTISPGCRDA